MNREAAPRPTLGRSLLRLEDPSLLTGRGEFVGDIGFPHQLHTVSYTHLTLPTTPYV